MLLYSTIHILFIALLSYRRTLYETLSKIITTKYLHLMHSISLIIIISLTSKSAISFFLNNLTSDEKSSINENLIFYITDIIVVISIFTSKFSIINFIELAFIINLRVFNWILDLRCRNNYLIKELFLTIILAILTLLAAIISLIISLKYNTIKILFCYEYSVLLISFIKNISFLLLNKFTEEETHDYIRMKITFLIEILYIITKLIVILIFFIYTTIKIRIPFNVLREFIKGISILFYKTKNYFKVNLFYKLIDKCKTVQGTCPICRDEMSQGKEIMCGHSFHTKCIKTWAEKQMVCPVCRTEILVQNEDVRLVE